MSATINHVLTLNWLDFTILFVIVFSTLISLVRGFLSEAVSLVTWIVAFILGFKFSAALSPKLTTLVHSNHLRLIVSFIIIFVVILIIGTILNHFLGKFVKKTGLSGTNRLLGMVFGLARGILLVAIFILFGKLTSMTRTTWWHSSCLVPYFMGIAISIQQVIPEHLQQVSHLLPNSTHGQ